MIMRRILNLFAILNAIIIITGIITTVNVFINASYAAMIVFISLLVFWDTNHNIFFKTVSENA